MTEQTKQKLKYWLMGLFTGGAAAAPLTAFFCKRIYDKKIEEAETNGMNAMAAYAISQQQTETKTPKEPEKEEDNYAEPTEYDVSIDDDDPEDQAARERTEAHERYLDMIDKYNGNTDIQPHIISDEEFSNEQYMEKSFINWYEEDNVFEEDLSTIDDPYATFGVTDGHELFKNAETRPDPDICYVRNEKITTDFEISRIRGSYAKMVGGEASLGETDT